MRFKLAGIPAAICLGTVATARTFGALGDAISSLARQLQLSQARSAEIPAD